MELVNEGDDLAARVGDLLEDGLQALFELAPVLGSGDHRSEIEGDDPPIPQPLRYISFDDAICESLDDGSLADAGLPDQNRVVLGAAREDLDDTADLLVTPDHRVELPLAGCLGEVPAVAFESLVAPLGVRRGHAVAPAYRSQSGQQLVVADGDDVCHRHQDMLDRQVVVAHVLLGALRRIEALAQVPAHLRLGAVGVREAGDDLAEAGPQGGCVDTGCIEDRERDAVGLAEGCQQDVPCDDLRIVRGGRRFGRLGKGFARLERPIVGIECHQRTTSQGFLGLTGGRRRRTG